MSNLEAGVLFTADPQHMDHGLFLSHTNYYRKSERKARGVKKLDIFNDMKTHAL